MELPPLHLTKIAYGAQSLEDLHSWFQSVSYTHLTLPTIYSV